MLESLSAATLHHAHAPAHVHASAAAAASAGPASSVEPSGCCRLLLFAGWVFDSPVDRENRAGSLSCGLQNVDADELGLPHEQVE